MKKILLLLSVVFITSISQAQVSINITGATANNSAMLDISSSNKGLLIPRVYLSSTVDNTTIQNPAVSLLVYNTNSGLYRGAGFYYNSGTAASPSWQAMQDFVLPFTKSTSDNGSAFTIANYSQNASSAAIKAIGGGAGNALEVSGKIKIAGNGQEPAAGKVLTSDANGNATWEGAIAFSASGIPGGGSQDVSPNVVKKVAYAFEDYDIGNNFNPAAISPHSTFTAPVKGVYHFDAQFTWVYDDNDFRSTIYLTRDRNGVVSILAEQETWKYDALEGNSLSKDVLLEAGDKIYIQIQASGSSTRSLLTDRNMNFFNGHLVFKL